MTGLRDQDTRELWIVQRTAPHYRIPIWDRLAERLGSEWRLWVFANMEHYRAVPGDTRAYLRHMNQRSMLGMFGWPELLSMIRRARPAAVISEASPRNLTVWRLPREVRRAGGRSIVWTKGHRDIDRADNAVSDYVRRRTIGSFDAVLTYGRSAVQELMRLGIPEQRIFVAQNTIETSRVFDQIAKLEAAGQRLRAEHGLIGRRVVLFPGTMFPKKRQLDLVNAWPMLRHDYPELTLVFVGGGENLDLVRARAQAVDSDRILVIGRVPDGVDYEWIAACDVAVQCGGLGLAINQSLALGKPTVVADEPSVDGELVVDGVTGWRYPRGDVAALARTIGSVLSSPDEAARIAAAGREVILERATTDHMVNGFIDALIFCGLIDGR